MTTVRTANGSHQHVFHDGNPLAERNTRYALLLTFCMMIAEIVAGYAFNSMALLADGWHMSSHTLALGLAVVAYRAARRYASDPRFAFGTFKIEILGGYTSALLLLVVAGSMLVQSIERLISPAPIHYDEAIVVAAIGLLVNLACAWLLKGGSHDGHGHHHSHGHGHHHGTHHGSPHGHAASQGSHGSHADDDLNLRSAYVHVLADAATSVLAIIALFGGKLWGAAWLDPVMGLVGAALVTVWAVGLTRDTAKVLIDAEMDAPITEEIREVIAASRSDARIDDLHVWRVGRGRYACIIALTAQQALTPATVRQWLSVHEELVHVTVEVNVSTQH